MSATKALAAVDEPDSSYWEPRASYPLPSALFYTGGLAGYRKRPHYTKEVYV
jgi:hypothetical protein